MESTIVDTVKQNTDSRCHTTACVDSGSSLQMAGAPQPYALISLENEFSPADKSQSHCDFLFVGGLDGQNGGPWVAPVELGNKKTSVLLAQLRGGATIAAALIPKSVLVKFKPIFAHTGGLHRQEFDTLRKDGSKVRFRNQNILVATVRSGTRLADALKG